MLEDIAIRRPGAARTSDGFDESSFDAATWGTKLPPDYRQHFTSFDGKNRRFVVEGAGDQAGSPNTMC